MTDAGTALNVESRAPDNAKSDTPQNVDSGAAGNVTPPAPSRRSDVVNIINTGLIVFAATVFAFAFFLLIPSSLQHGRSQTGLVRRFRTELATERAPIGGLIPNAAPVAMLNIPAIGVHEVVVQGTTSADTREGPGHLAASVMPGQAGNSVILGRRIAYGGPFRHLPSLKPGDEIHVTTGQGTADYSVVSSGTQSGKDAQALLPTPDARLTLVTSDPPVLANRYKYVTARLQSQPFDATGHVARIGRAELGLTGDTSAMPTIFVWLLVAALVGGAAIIVFRRVPRACGWLIVAPIALAVMWLVFENFVVVLPTTL